MKIYFRGWFYNLFEGIESLNEKKQKVLNIINSSKNYVNTIEKLTLNKIIDIENINKFLNSLYQGSYLVNQFYNYLKKTNQNVESNLSDEDLLIVTKNIVNKYKNIGHSQENINPWYFFHFKDKILNSSNKKLHIRINPNEISTIYKLVDYIMSNIEYFSQFKFSKYADSFKNRRDNFVLFLDKNAQENLDKISLKLKEMNIDFELGNDYRLENDKVITNTESVAIELAVGVVTKPEFPENKKNYLWKDSHKIFIYQYLNHKEDFVEINANKNLQLSPARTNNQNISNLDKINYNQNIICRIDSILGKNNFVGMFPKEVILNKTPIINYFPENMAYVFKLDGSWNIKKNYSQGSQLILIRNNIKKEISEDLFSLKENDIICLGNINKNIFIGELRVNFI